MNREHRMFGLLLGLSVLFGSSSCALLCPPPDPETITQFSLVTPEATFHTFQEALKAGNEYYEYRCLSRQLLEEHDIDFQKYVLGRPYVLRKHRKEIARFKRSTITEVNYDLVHPEGNQIAEVRLSDGELEGQFLLINNPYWEIAIHRALEEPDLIFGDVRRLEAHFRVEDGVLEATLPLPSNPEIRPDSIAGLEMKNEWKVLQFLGISPSAGP